MAFTGTVTLFTFEPTAKCTSPNDPGNSRPSLFGTSTSVSRVRVVGSMDSAVRAILAEELLSGKFLQRNRRRRANLDIRCVGLRNAGVDPKRIDAREIEQFPPRCARSGIDQSARIDIAFCQHSRERSIDFLESFELFKAFDVRIRSRKIGLRLLVSAGLLVRLLRRNGIALPQVLPAVCTDFRQVQLRDNLFAARPGSDSVPDRLPAYRSSPVIRLP